MKGYKTIKPEKIIPKNIDPLKLINNPSQYLYQQIYKPVKMPEFERKPIQTEIIEKTTHLSIKGS